MKPKISLRAARRTKCETKAGNPCVRSQHDKLSDQTLRTDMNFNACSVLTVYLDV